jgi:predicted ferric reductase
MTAQELSSEPEKPLFEILGFFFALVVSLISALALAYTLADRFDFALMSASLDKAVPYLDKLPWYLSRASGAVAYLVLSASTAWGLLLNTKLVKSAVPAPLTLAMHNYLGWNSLVFSALHGFVLLFDKYYTFTFSNLLIPFSGPYKPLWVGVGILAFYLILLTTLSFYVRAWIGQKTWRRLHFLTFPLYGMASLHGLQAGTDSGILRTVYLGSAILIVFLTVYRVLAARSARA